MCVYIFFLFMSECLQLYICYMRTSACACSVYVYMYVHISVCVCVRACVCVCNMFACVDIQEPYILAYIEYL